MPEQAPDYRALCEAMGWPPIAGGSPDDPDAEDTPTAQDTPEETASPSTEETPAAEDSTDDTDWQKRYEDLRPQWDRTQQENAELRELVQAAGQGDPEALERLGLPVEDEDDDDDLFAEEPDPNEEIAKLREEMAEEKEAAELEEFEQLENEYCEEAIGQLEGSEKFELTDEEYDFVVDRAIATRGEDGQLDLEGSFKAFKDSVLDRSKKLVESKDAPVPPAGASGDKKIDLRDKEARQKYATEVYEAAERAQSD